MPRDVRISKTLTQILRHKAPDLGIEMDKAGFCRTEDVLNAQWLKELECTRDDVEKVVKKSDKQRFEVQVIDGVHRIRAVQGHSIGGLDDEEALERLTETHPELPTQCVHGTYLRHVDAIRANGLKAGGTEGAAFRKHVHFSPFAPGDKRVISGMRYDAEVAIWVDMKGAMEAGIAFYISTNKVILSPGNEGVIPEKFLEKIVNLKTKEDIFVRR
jgi:2'-phosphotransferase